MQKKLLENAGDASNTPQMTYALISESAKFATEDGDIPLVIQAANLLNSRFEGDGVRQARYKMLKSLESSKAKISPDSLSSLADAYLAMAEEYLAEQEVKDVSTLIADAERVAKKSKKYGSDCKSRRKEETGRRAFAINERSFNGN